MHHYLLFLYALLGTCFFSAHAMATEEAEPKTLTVLAEPSLTVPMAEITRLYSVKQNVSLLTAFANSKINAAKISEGESADVLITTLPDVVFELKQRGLVDVYTQSIFATNRLVLSGIKSKETHTPRKLLEAAQHQPLLLANPKTHAEGRSGLGIMQYLTYNNRPPVPPHIYNNLRALYGAIKRKQGVGVILATEAELHPEFNLVVPVTGSSYPPIAYQAVVIAGENMPIARDFISFLESKEAQAVFVRHGFITP